MIAEAMVITTHGWDRQQLALCGGGEVKVWDLVPSGLLTDAAELLNTADTTLTSTEFDRIVLVPTIPAYGDDGLSVQLRVDLMLLSATGSGWVCIGEPARIVKTGWITWENHATGRRLYMGILDLIDASRTPLFDPKSQASEIAYDLSAYARATGTAWRMTAGVTGCAAVRKSITDQAARRAERRGDGVVMLPKWHSNTLIGPAASDIRASGEIRWEREPTDAERQGWVHHFDIRSQFLAAAASALLPWSGMSYHENQAFDPANAGYWLVDATGIVHRGGPPVVRPDLVRDDGRAWITTPMMSYLNELGINPEVHAARFAPTSARLLRPWAENLRDRIEGYRNYPRYLAALKRTYTETIGMFNSDGGSIFRPEWRDIIIDLARANMLRKIRKVHKTMGVWPLRIYADSVWYPHDDQWGRELVGALGVADSIGKFRTVSAVTGAEYWKD